MGDDYNIPIGSCFLVTGGAGFIGSNLVEKILRLGYKVRVLDNFSTGKEENIEEFLNDDNFHLVRGDIRSLKDCYQACQGVDYVLHLGALGSVPMSIEDPKTTNDVNMTGTLNMLIAARDNRVDRFVFTSSSSVYGDDNSLPNGDVQHLILMVKPGITDYASVEYKEESNILGQYDDPEEAYLKHILSIKLQLNLRYIYEMSILTDLKLIFITIFNLLRLLK